MPFQRSMFVAKIVSFGTLRINITPKVHVGFEKLQPQGKFYYIY